MIYFLILFGVFSLDEVHGYDDSSTEINKIEASPIYDTIILSDVADIINEYDNNMNTPLDAFLTSDSESDENLDDLLSEYQHHLEKAHKQRLNYLDKVKAPKNKLPLIRRDRYSKLKPGVSGKHDDYFYTNGFYYPNKIPQTPFSSPLDVFIPMMNTKPKFDYGLEPLSLTTARSKLFHDDVEKRFLDLPTAFSKGRLDPIKPNCFCKSGQFSCDCNPIRNTFDTLPPYFPQNSVNTEYNTADDKSRDENDHTINIRIKVDIALPKALDPSGKMYRNRTNEEEILSKEVNVPILTYFTVPSTPDLFGFKKSIKSNKHEPFHNKITIHKKKKSKLTSSNKKHRKRVIAYHNVINIEPQRSFNTTLNSNKTNPINTTACANVTARSLIHLETASFIFNASQFPNKTDVPLNNNDTQIVQIISFPVNTTHNENVTEDIHQKNENSLEGEYAKTDSNLAGDKITSLRLKREIPVNITQLSQLSNNSNIKKVNHKQIKSVHPVKHFNETKKSDKMVFADTEILYWPNNTRNHTENPLKNITTIILEKENKKGKINMTKESIKINRTRALEKAVFGDINWDDVDAVAPVFMSFVGKYIRGILTFCSLNVCHSMKCGDKICVHRTCTPNDRWNHRGHCGGSNYTDTVASLESIMDLPSNIAFEIVDILQERMLGKMYGKVTLCIISKCSSFVSFKKNFLKSKCSAKELNKLGHCTNLKSFKIM